MLRHRKIARQRLKDCSIAEYNSLIHDAKLTPTQKVIIDSFIIGNLPVCEIAFKLSLCESMIRRHLSIVYDKVAFL